MNYAELRLARGYEAMSAVMPALEQARYRTDRGNYAAAAYAIERAAEAACRAAWHWDARPDGERP